MSLKSALPICNYLLAGLAPACLVLSEIYSPLSGLIFSVGIILCISRKIEESLDHFVILNASASLSTGSVKT